MNDAILSKLMRGMRALLGVAVVQEDAEVEDGEIEVVCNFSALGQRVVVEFSPASAGKGGFMGRIPKKGDTCLLGFADGDLDDGFWISYVNTAGAMPLPEGIEPGNLYVWAPDGENVRMRAEQGKGFEIGNGTIELLDQITEALTALATAFGTLSADVATPTYFGTSPLAGKAAYAEAQAALTKVKESINQLKAK